MKCTIPEISWHNRDPILSIDIQPVNSETFYRLSSGGTDCHVLIWHLKIRNTGAVDVDVVADLTRHQRAVNVVRWSPSGLYLASGDDDANIIIWTLKTDNIPLLDGETADKEIWIVRKILRGHKEDVYDICWSPNEVKLLSGSIDNTAIIWDFNKGLSDIILTDHKGFVQGVTWDPKGDFIATLSSDRICRIYDNTGKQIRLKTHKGLLPFHKSHPLYNKELKYFHDDTFKSYFRRLTFSPDGNLLITPSGCIEHDDFRIIRYTTLVFALDNLNQPAFVLPSPTQETVAVRCCPLLFELHSDGDSPVIDLPYRMIIAVATDNDVILYDTQQSLPFAHLQKIHYTHITDLAWSTDGLLLIASSSDGYCTLVTFDPEELGVQYVKPESEPEESILEVSGCEELDKSDTSKSSKENEIVESKPKKPNLLEQWTIRKLKTEILKEENLNGTSETIKSSTDATSDNQDIKKTKRIIPIRVESSNSVTNKIQNTVPSNSVASTDIPIKKPKRIIPLKICEIEKKKSVNSGSEIAKVINDNKKSSVAETVINKKKIVDSTNSFIEDKEELNNAKQKGDDMIVIEDANAKLKKINDTTNAMSRKRKLNTKSASPNPQNSLLQFLKPSPNNKGINKQEKVVSDKIKKEVPNECIEISDDEDVDKTLNKSIDANLQKSTNYVLVDVIELDDSNSGADSMIQQNAALVNVHENHSEKRLEPTNEQYLKQKKELDPSKDMETKVTTPKNPRRVSLVTLQSPKSRKKL